DLLFGELHRVLGARAAGVFPFGLSRQAIFLAGFFAEPDAVTLGRFVGDGDDREAGVAVAAVGGVVGFAGAGFGIDAGFFQLDFLVFGEVEAGFIDVVVVPEAFGFADPESFDLDFLGRGFAVGGKIEFAGRDLDHVEFDGEGVEGFDGFGLDFGLGGIVGAQRRTA